MILWRISRHRDLNGTGGLAAPGRWHYRGQPIVYLADSPASALLESCVHTSANDIPPEFTLLKIEGPDLRISSITFADLPKNWHVYQNSTRDLGTAWLHARESAVLRIPSALVPETWNFLFNPAHPDAARFRIAGAYPYPFDERLKR